MSLNENQNILNFTKLKSLGDKIAQYNIICEEFDNILKLLNQGQEWLENSKKFLNEYNNESNDEFTLLFFNNNNNINNNNYIIMNDNNKKKEEINIQEFMEIRNKNILKIEKYIKSKKIFFDDLLKLTQNVPSYLENTAESINLSNHVYLENLK